MYMSERTNIRVTYHMRILDKLLFAPFISNAMEERMPQSQNTAHGYIGWLNLGSNNVSP